MADEELIKSQLLVRYIRGFPVADHVVFPVECLEAAMDYIAKDNDVILCGFPRTGTTWSLYIVWQILHFGSSKCVLHDIPQLECEDIKVINDIPQPRFYKCHLPFYQMKMNKNAKYVYVYRKPEDAISSNYHFMKELSGNDFDVDFYFEAFMSGKVSFGDYFDHVLAAYDRRNDGNVYLLAYERLKKDTRGEMLRIAKFLGKNYHQELIRENEALLNKLLEISTFEYMKKNVEFPLPTNKDPNKLVDFYRHGRAGDGKRLLSEEQAKRLKDKILDKMKDTEIANDWLT